MTAEGSGKTPIDVLRAANPEAAARFGELRRAVEAGPLGQETVELAVCAALASVGQLSSLRVHVRRALKLGVPAGHLQQCVVATLGASAGFNEVVDALSVISEVYRAGPA